jgi:phosphohistidine swiveling domain-containing protein
MVIYVYRSGFTDCWVRGADKDNLGSRLLNEIKKDQRYIKKLADSLKNRAQEVFDFLTSNQAQNISQEVYKEFQGLVADYYLPHLSVKYIVDYLSPAQLKRFLPILERARLFSEPVFREIENFMEAVAKVIARRANYDSHHILSITIKELEQYFRNGVLPSKKVLANRYKKSVLLFSLGDYKILLDKQADNIENFLLPQKKSKIIKGSSAYGGRVQGVIHIITDPKKESAGFKKGEILVTGMTRPEFLPIMKKAAAFITDAGGILSHAAIVARELKKPCVIGAKYATKILKNGQLVEVDANKGIIKLI